MNHLQRTSNGATVNVVVLNALQLIGNLHVQGQRICIETYNSQQESSATQHAGLFVSIPILHRGRYTRVHGQRLRGDVLACCLERLDSPCVRFGEIVLYQPKSHVVSAAHSTPACVPEQFDLFVNLRDVLVVLHDLGYERAVRECQQLWTYDVRLTVHIQ